jgi:hypothetical protein
LEDLRVDGKITLEWMLGKQGLRPVVGSCEHCNEPSGSMKGREFLY